MTTFQKKSGSSSFFIITGKGKKTIKKERRRIEFVVVFGVRANLGKEGEGEKNFIGHCAY